MSSYSPKHIGPDESLSAQLREAGRKVLCGTMSLILAASLVPTPTVSYAEDVVRESFGSDARETDSDIENSDSGSSNESTDGVSEDQQSYDDGEQSDGGTPADQPSGGDDQYDGDQDGDDGQYGNDEQYGDAAPEDQQPYGDDELNDYSGDDGSNTSDDREYESSDPDAAFSEEDTSTRDTERSAGGSDGKFVARALLGAQDSENEEEEDQNESPKTVTEPSLAPEFTGLVEGTANQYKNCEVILKLRGTNLQVYESALATLGYTYSYTDAKGEKHVDNFEKQQFAYEFIPNAEGTEVSVAFPLESPGIYEGFTASISGVAYDDEELDYELSNEPISVAQPLWVLDNEAPLLVSATLENENTTIDVMGDTDNELIVELGDASSIVVRLSDDSLNMDEDVSFVQVVNEKGEAFEVGGKLAWGFKKESEDSKSYVATIHNDGKIEGKVAIRVVAQTVGAPEDEMLDIALRGNQEADKTVKANGLLVIDGSRPVVESVTTASKEMDVPENEGSEPTDFLTNSGYLEVTVSDDSLDTHKEASYIQLEDENGNVVKDEDDQEKVALFNNAEQGDGDSSHYEAALNIENVPDGRYLLRVVAQDTLCEQVDDAAKARHEHVEKTYGPIVLDRVKPQIADVVTMVETEADPVEKQVSDGDMLRANKLIVSVEDNNSLNEEDSTVTLTKRVNGEDFAKQYKYEDCKNADGDFEIDDIETGTYDIVVSIVDSAGNPASLSIENVTFDSEMPQIGNFSYADPKTYKAQKVVRLTEDGAPVEITVDDYSFDADKVQFAVARKASAKEKGAGTSYDVVEPLWNGSTATLTFAEEGIYTIEVSAEDTLGNGVARKSETFVVSAQPVVEVKLADDSPWSEPIATVGDESTETGQYFNAPVVCDVTIAGSFIDLDETLIAGVPLSKIDESKGYKNEGETFSISKPLVQEDGSYKYTVTYSEGAHSSSSNPDLPVVKAKDWYAVANKEDFVVGGEFQPFTVDTVAPTVMFSESNSKYVNLDGHGIKAIDSKVLFFNQPVEDSTKGLVFAVADNVAIKSVKMKYSSTDGGSFCDTVYKVENGEVVVGFSDDAEFLDVDELTVTDMAGNSSVWSLKEVKSHTSAVDDAKKNEVLGVKQPIKLVEDHTAPVLTFKDHKDYYTQNVSIPLTIIERNLNYFIELKEFAPETISPVVLEKKDDEGVYQELKDTTFPIYDAKLIDAKQFEWELPISITAPDDHSMDGHYRLTAQLTDLAGNSSEKVPVKFTIDTTAPSSSIDFKGAEEIAYANGAGLTDVDGTYYAVKDGETFKKIVTIKEHNFDPEKFKVVAEPIDAAASDSAPTIEREDSGDTHTYTVSFPSEGKYRLSVQGNDNAGNPLETVSEELYVDYSNPVVVLSDYPSEDAKKDYVQIADKGYEGTPKDGADYFAHLNTITATIVERYLDPERTTVNGERLIDILAGAAGVTESASYAALLESVSLDNTYVSKSTGISYRMGWDAASYTYTILIDYPDGEFNLPIVAAYDRKGAFDEDDKVFSNANSFVVDGKAPNISAYITTSPSALTSDALGEQITNGAENADARVYFYSHKYDPKEHEIWFEVKEDFGIRSVELFDDRNDCYVLDKVGVTASVAKVQAEGGAYIFRITGPLADARDFSNKIKVKITDFAGNYYIWSMSPVGEIKEGGSDEKSSKTADLYYMVNEEVKHMLHPTLLVEDNVAPELELTDVAGEAQVEGYGRFFNTTQGIRLDVLERNLKYLRGYEGPDGTKAFDGLDPDRTVLTVERRENKAGEKLLTQERVPVKDLDPDLDGVDGEYSPQFAGGYTYSREFRADQEGHAQDGHYSVSAQLTDLVGNASDTLKLEEFTIDTKAPELSVTYTTGDEAVRPSSASTETVYPNGMPRQDGEEPYYQVSPEHGLTAVIRVDEHNFAPELFREISAKQLDPMDGDAEFKFVYDQTKWVAEGDTYTYEIHFPGEGRYKVHVGGTDKAGNPVEEYDYVFNVDMYAPTVEVSFPKDDRTQGYDGKRGQEVVCESPESTMFFSEEPEVVVHIEDRFLATWTKEDTTINGAPLAEVLQNVVQGGPYVQETEGKKVTYTSATIKWDSGRHAWVYEVRMTYHDGEYDTPLVKVADRSGRVAGKTGNEDPSVYDGVDHFVVDCSAPEITEALITAVPAMLTRTADGKVVKDVIQDYGKNQIWFFTGAVGSEKHTIKLTASDPHGVRSVELYDPSGRYRLDEGATMALVKGEGVCFPIIDTLVDGKDFSDEVIVRVTDFAGNWHEWTMREDRLYDAGHRGSAEERGVPIAGEADLVSQVRALNHPTLLVEDNVAPALKLPEIPSDGALAAKGYGRFFNTTQSIRLGVTERNLKYLRGYEGFKGLDPSRSVLTISYKADKYNAEYQTMSGHARIVRVKDLIPKVTNGITESDARFVGRYSFPRQFVADFNNHSEDGHYLVSAELTDLVGNKSNDGEPIKLEEFTIDTKAPEVTVAYNSAPKKQTANGRDYYDAARIATITVVEHNFDPNLFTIDVSHFVNHASGAKAPSFSWDNSRTDTHVCTVEFPSDGEYRLVVRGQDKAGNAAVFASSGVANKQTTYDSGLFVIDTENPVIADVYDYGQAPQRPSRPVVQFPQPTGQYGGKNYYSHPIEIYSYVMDRNFDPASTRVYRYHNGTESIQNVTWSLNGGRDQNAYEVYSTKVSYTEDGDYRTPHVKNAVDFAMRTTENDPKDFVVDLVAPSISVEVDRTPTSTGVANDANDPIQFFNVATRMTFSMHDDHRIRKFWLDDPEGEYVVTETSNNVEGNLDATLVIALRDGADVSNDTEYERDITLTVQDLAGNRRIWTIDRTGKVIMDQVESGDANRSINEEGIYPLALIQDTTAPTVALSGVTEGTFYNTTQSVRCDINEFNFDYLKRFDPSRVIVHVTKYEGNAGRAQSSWTVSASEFVGSSPSYSFDQAFEGDGHYEIYAEFLDYANNQSGRASIGEFTIDKTAPVINIAWDNNDVLNGKYYKAGRTATITVTEHNFDASLFTVNSNGSISGWSSSGDTHTCTVTFDTDGTYNLSVSGRDRAGNEATSVTEPEFVVDLTSPKITFSGLVQRYGVDRGKKDADGKQQLENEYRDDLDKDGGDINAEDPDETLQDRHAYNGIVMPAIEFYDQAGNGATNYDSQNVSYTLIGGKHGTNTQDFRYTVQDGNGGQTYQFDDFGLVTEALSEGGHNVYDPAADDVYTIEAKMTDLAGNEAQGQVTFSVNRYGSNFVVEAFSVDDSKHESIIGAQSMDGIDYDLLGSAPRIEVHEINVSGSESEADHAVLKEYANAVTQLASVKESDSRRDGYVVDSVEPESSEAVSKYGWSEYVYTIREGNFGIDSPSDSGDGGQGVYRVNVTSVDRASNDTSTSEYLNTADYEEASSGASKSWANPEKAMRTIADSLRNATVAFTLDEIAPIIDELNVPNLLAVGSSYAVTVHVTDAITRGDTVSVYVDGRELEEGEFSQRGNADGTGIYEFQVATNYIPFATHEVKVVASDTVEGRDPVTIQSERFMVTILVPEIAVIALIVGGITGGVVLYRKRKAVAEPEKPYSY